MWLLPSEKASAASAATEAMVASMIGRSPAGILSRGGSSWAGAVSQNSTGAAKTPTAKVAVAARMADKYILLSIEGGDRCRYFKCGIVWYYYDRLDVFKVLCVYVFAGDKSWVRSLCMS